MFYLGDADPYGAEIFFTFLFGSLSSCLLENKTKSTTLFALEWIGPFMQEYVSPGLVSPQNILRLNERDQSKAFSLLSRPYLSDNYLKTCKCEEEACFKARLNDYKTHIKLMATSQTKFEIEALIAGHSNY